VRESYAKEVDLVGHGEMEERWTTVVWVVGERWTTAK